MTVSDEEDTLIKLADVLLIVPVSESTIMRMIKQDRFPKPIKLAANLSLWVEQEVRAWIKDEMAKRADRDEFI